MAAASSSASGKPRTAALSATSDVLDVSEFERLRAEMEADDGVREAVIKRSRDVLKLSKTAIYCLHRGQGELAETNLAEAQRIATDELLPMTTDQPQLRCSGALPGALEEYAEGRVFQAWLRDGRVAGPAAPGLGGLTTRDEYLGGVMDFVGEVTRTAVLAATKRDAATVERAREAVADVHMALMGFDFRNGQLRRKFDAIKYSLKKLEQVTYELSLAQSLAGLSAAAREDAPDTEAAPGAKRPKPDGGDDA